MMYSTLFLSLSLSRYVGSNQFGKMGYEDEFLECLERTVRDLDKRIRRGKERLARSAEANNKVKGVAFTMGGLD